MDASAFLPLGLRPELVRAVAEQGYTTPTPIQVQAIPVVLQGRDLLGAAQTGTGKTAGFTLPMLQLLNATASRQEGRSRHPRALILTPTRELAAQVAESVATYGKYQPMRSTMIFGGVNINPQIDALRRGVDIVIATPGRLLDHVEQKTVDLSHIEILVLDEADRMLDMGFIRDIRKILKLLPARRQNLLFSATFSDEIRELAGSFLHDPATVEVARRNTTAELVSQCVYPVHKDRKRELLSHLVKQGNWFQVLVFTRTKHGANRLAQQLERDGIQADAIHGNKSQNARTRALARFKASELQVLVATDLAARGLDIEELPHVVNYDLPHVPEDYVHRIGRTGRAGASGEAISLVCADDRPLLAAIERLIQRRIEQRHIEGFDTPRPGAARDDDDRPPRPDGRGGRHRNQPRGGQAGRAQEAARVRSDGHDPVSEQDRDDDADDHGEDMEQDQHDQGGKQPEHNDAPRAQAAGGEAQPAREGAQGAQQNGQGNGAPRRDGQPGEGRSRRGRGRRGGRGGREPGAEGQPREQGQGGGQGAPRQEGQRDANREGGQPRQNNNRQQQRGRGRGGDDDNRGNRAPRGQPQRRQDDDDNRGNRMPRGGGLVRANLPPGWGNSAEPPRANRWRQQRGDQQPKFDLPRHDIRPQIPENIDDDIGNRLRPADLKQPREIDDDIGNRVDYRPAQPGRGQRARGQFPVGPMDTPRPPMLTGDEADIPEVDGNRLDAPLPGARPGMPRRQGGDRDGNRMPGGQNPGRQGRQNGQRQGGQQARGDGQPGGQPGGQPRGDGGGRRRRRGGQGGGQNAGGQRGPGGQGNGQRNGQRNEQRGPRNEAGAAPQGGGEGGGNAQPAPERKPGFVASLLGSFRRNKEG